MLKLADTVSYTKIQRYVLDSTLSNSQNEILTLCNYCIKHWPM